MSERAPLRLCLDSNVLTGGIVAPWGLDKAVLSLCAACICRMVLAAIVQDKVEDNLLHHAAALPADDAEHVLADYSRLLTLARPEIVPCRNWRRCYRRVHSFGTPRMSLCCCRRYGVSLTGS